jgi:hypothetical protein
MGLDWTDPNEWTLWQLAKMAGSGIKEGAVNFAGGIKALATSAAGRSAFVQTFTSGEHPLHQAMAAEQKHLVNIVDQSMDAGYTEEQARALVYSKLTMDVSGATNFYQAAKGRDTLSGFIDSGNLRKLSTEERWRELGSGELKAAAIAAPAVGNAAGPNAFWNRALGSVARVGTGGLRGEVALTAEQEAAARQYAVSLGMPADRISVSANMNTSYSRLFSREQLYIGTDVMPATTPGLGPNSYISMRGSLAHELVGHRAAALAGRGLSGWAEEAQASMRAAALAPGLTFEERMILVRDAMARAGNQGASLRSGGRYWFGR